MTRETRSPKRVILDTSVLVAGFRSSNGASAELLRCALRGEFEMAASTAVFLEYEDVLQRDSQRKAHGRSQEQVARFLSTLSLLIVPVDIYFQWRPQLQDDNDEMILDAAINGRVDAIVTHNLKDFLPASARFGISVITPSQFLREVRR